MVFNKKIGVVEVKIHSCITHGQLNYIKINANWGPYRDESHTAQEPEK